MITWRMQWHAICPFYRAVRPHDPGPYDTRLYDPRLYENGPKLDIYSLLHILIEYIVKLMLNLFVMKHSRLLGHRAIGPGPWIGKTLQKALKTISKSNHLAT